MRDIIKISHLYLYINIHISTESHYNTEHTNLLEKYITLSKKETCTTLQFTQVFLISCIKQTHGYAVLEDLEIARC